jgi:nitrite reductase (NO-forming)
MSQAARSTSLPEPEGRAVARPPDGAPRPRPGRDRPPEPRPRPRIGPIGPVRRTVILVALSVAVTSTFQWATGPHGGGTAHHHAAPAGQAAGSAVAAGHAAHHGTAVAAAPASRVAYERYHRPDPTLPAIPAGPVKRFRVDVLMHETKVAADQPPLRVWSFGVNGHFMRGTGVSPPMVVEQGDRVEVTLVNGASKAMHVDMPHSLDMHAAEIAPNLAFKTIPPGATTHYSFIARHPGVYMYHCATQPMVMHLGSGMVGMFVVKPRHLPKVDRELWLVQQEYFLPQTPGGDSDYDKMLAEKPDVIAFNGYADQYMRHPFRVRAGERIRMYVLNPGPTHTTSFHVIGAVFDRFSSEGVTGGPAQVMALPPSTGGWVDFTLRGEGAYPFVDHNFASMAKGAMGTLLTTHAPPGAADGF